MKYGLFALVSTVQVRIWQNKIQMLCLALKCFKMFLKFFFLTVIAGCLYKIGLEYEELHKQV